MRMVICFADSNTIVTMWKSYFSKLWNVHKVSDVRQMEIHTAEPILPGPSHLEVEIDLAKLTSINLQAMVKFRQKCIEQEVKH
jgi:hypothetical protein